MLKRLDNPSKKVIFVNIKNKQKPKREAQYTGE
jgi:hypothetical protein